MAVSLLLIMARKQYFNDNAEYDYIMREYHAHDMSEFVTSMGGDVTTYRVYRKNEKDFFLVCR